MFVLEATSETQGARDDDYTWTIEGEPVLPPLGGCADDRCGCDRGFAGMRSHRATTTARIADRPVLDEDGYRDLLIEGLEEQGYGVVGRELLDDLVDAFVSTVQALGRSLGPGTVLGCSAGSLLVRLRPIDSDHDGTPTTPPV